LAGFQVIILWPLLGDHRGLRRRIHEAFADNGARYGPTRLPGPGGRRRSHQPQAGCPIHAPGGAGGLTAPTIVCTTDSRHGFRIAPNLVARNFAPPEPNRFWATDITNIRTQKGWLYLAVVLDRLCPPIGPCPDIPRAAQWL